MKKIYLCIAICTLFVIAIYQGITLSNTTMKIDELGTKFDGLVVSLQKYDAEKYHTVIDLSSTAGQSVQYNFIIAIKNIDTHLTGIKLFGEILNNNAIMYDNITFNFKIGTVSKDITLYKIRSGFARNFELYIPDVSIEQVKTAEVSYMGGNYSYYDEK